jgi:hypothetical protein
MRTWACPSRGYPRRASRERRRRFSSTRFAARITIVSVFKITIKGIIKDATAWNRCDLGSRGLQRSIQCGVMKSALRAA